MAKERVHRYKAGLMWTGNTGGGTVSYGGYSRNHEFTADRKAAPLPMSSDAAFRGDPTRYTPEELLVGALSSCHMLWFLHLCSAAGIVVTQYSDQPEGVMAEHESGAGEFTGVTLRPVVELADPSRLPELAAIHHQAHDMCFIARSVNFPVKVETS